MLFCIMSAMAVVMAVPSVVGDDASNLMGGKRHDVYIAGFFPYDKSVPESHIGRGVMPAVKLAVDHINENPSVLRNHLLHMWWNDTQCNAAVGMKALFDMIHEGPHKLMLFGAACTQVTDPIAKASKQWKLTQLSYADTHPMFEPKNFPNLFRMVPSENAFNPPRLRLLETFNWTRVGTIYQNEPRFSLAHNKLVAELDSAGMDVVEAQSFSDEVTTALSKLQEKDVRIILGNFNESWAREIFCQAYRIGIYGKRYQWLIMGTYSNKWWANGELPGNCTIEQLLDALEGVMLTDLLPLSTDGGITVSGQTPEEYRREYDSRRGDEYSRFHGYTYDGVWTVALAIQHVARRIRLYRKNETMQHFRYRDHVWETLFLHALANTSFEGVTGPVRFYNNERKASIMLKQFQGGKDVKVGEYNGVSDTLDFSCGGAIKWLGTKPPKDRTLQIFEHSQVNVTVYCILAAAAAVGILLTIAFLSINIMFRNQRYIKMSSPYLNNLIIIGCMLTYTSVIFLGLDSQLTSVDAFPYICTARAWLLMSGFSLAFGSMFSKTWRVHSIFTDVKLNKKVIKDYQLFMVVGVLVGIDLAIMTTWQVADPFYRETKEMDPYPHPNNHDDVIIVPVNEYCQSNYMTIFVGTIYAYKGLLMIFGAFLAWETRHVSIPALNDSKYVGMSVYNVVIMCVMGAAISFVLSDKQDASFLIISVFIIFCTTATLFLVFVPKLVELRRNPQGVIDNKTRATLRPIAKSRRDSVASELEDKIKDAKQFNSKYRKQLLDIESELQILVRRAGPEASAIVAVVESGDRLSVPYLKREPPSATETTEISSLCSLNSSQDGEMSATQTPMSRKRSGTGKRTTFEDESKHESILRKDQQKPKTRFCDEPFPGKNVSFGPANRPAQQQQPIQVAPVPATVAVVREPELPAAAPALAKKLHKSEHSLEKLGITLIHPHPYVEQTYENVQLPSHPRAFSPPDYDYSNEFTNNNNNNINNNKNNQQAQQQQQQQQLHHHHHHYHHQTRTKTPPPSFPPPDLQKLEEKIQEVTSHLTTQLLKRHDEQYSCSSLHRRSSVRSAQLSGVSGIPGGGKRRTSVPNWAYVEKKNSRNKRPVCRKHGFIEAVGSDMGSDHELDGVKFIDKNDYWVCQPDRRGSGSSGGGILTPHRSPPPSYLLNHSQNNLSSPNVMCDDAQNLDCSGMHRSVSERERGGGRCGIDGVRPAGCGTGGGGGRFNTNLTHVLSTPDVASIRPYYDPKMLTMYGTERRKPRKQMSGGGSGHLCTAVSEGELLDLAILPIFQKLLTERHKSRTGYGSAIASCPNISIKCDIVEYL